MLNSIIRNKILTKTFFLGLWLILWHLLAEHLNQSILLVSPVKVLARLNELIWQHVFWQSISNSLGRILIGFLGAASIGSILAFLAQLPLISDFLLPPISLIKATPVASFTILALFWLPATNLSVLISFLMVLPIVFFNVQEGLKNVDRQLLDMAQVFQLSYWKKIRAIYIPSILPYFISACNIGLGQAWKSGIAAEVIALPSKSIGMNLYNAKVYLENADLLAWTAVIIILSLIMEQLFVWLVKHVK